MTDSSERHPDHSRRSFLHRTAQGAVGAAVGAGAVGAGTARAGDVSKARAQATEADHVNVKDFGAVGDGETDDTNAIQKAVNSAQGGIWLPKGRYRVTEPVMVELNEIGPCSITGDGTATVVMEGAGPAFHLLGTHDGTGNPDSVDPEVWQNQRMPLVDGFEVLGEHPESIGIRAEGVMQPIFSRLLIRRCMHGIHLYKRDRNVLIGECNIYHNRRVGIYLDQVNLHQINIANCHISYNRGGGIVVRNSEVRNLQVGTCDLEANMHEESPETANILLDTRGGRIREGAVVGCTIQHSGSGPNSANIRMIGQEMDDPKSVGRFTIADNVMDDVDINVHLQYARGVSITGNDFWHNDEITVLVENSSHILFGENLNEWNPDYGDGDASNHHGIIFRDSRDCAILGNDFHHTRNTAAGLVLERCDWFNVNDNQFLDCEGAGLLMEDVSYSKVSGNSFRNLQADGDQHDAIRARGGQENMISDNLIRGPVNVESGTAELMGNKHVE